MINLWYSENYWAHTNGVMNGPQKVVSNLLSSLHQENVPFSINNDEYKCNMILQYDALGHSRHEMLEHDTCFIGPQFWGWDCYGKFLFENPQYYNKLIVPCEWVRNQLISSQFSVPKDKVSVWSVGIECLSDVKDYQFDCLVYFKRRSKEDLNKVINFLESKKLTYKIVSYGNYESTDLEVLSNQSKFCFLLNGSESQGIAVQEIMSTNTPMFVWDIKEWNDMGEDYKTPASSVPYWDSLCGEIFYEYNEIEFTFSKFYDNITSYNPKKFVEDNLSFKASVRNLLNITGNI